MIYDIFKAAFIIPIFPRQKIHLINKRFPRFIFYILKTSFVKITSNSFVNELF